MRELNVEQLEYAIGRLVHLVEYREIKQTHLAQLSGVSQSQISKILSRSSENGGDGNAPSEELLRKLFHALGLKLADILNESECLPNEILGYLGTPLTSLSEKADKELRRVVDAIRTVASEERFQSPRFDIYWPGDFTHPLEHANILPNQVYITDRSRASSYDFVVLFCGATSYGVGQENEIASQAGVPAIRLIPASGISRMMTGSFLRSIDISFSGSLDTGVVLNAVDLRNALQEIRKIYFRHRALYRGLNKDGFGGRLKKLVDDRCGDYVQFATDLGISLSYLHVLMKEPFVVSNPSARLLGRIAARLGERVAYLLGESEEVDPIWVESSNSWRLWIEKTPNLDARTAVNLRDQWRHDYRAARQEQQSSSASFRTSSKLMREVDWDNQYRQKASGTSGRQDKLL